jgi:ribonuclease T1
MRAKQNNTKLWSVLILTLGLIVAFFIFNGSDFISSIPNNKIETQLAEPVTGHASLSNETTDSIPDYVRKTYNFIITHGDAPHGYYGGRTFQNREKRLPLKTPRGQAIHYREWDVHPRRDGVDRGAERLVTGSDGSAWFTANHYQSFFLIERNTHGK